MTRIVIEQALYQRQGDDSPQLLARSPGFRDEWLAPSEELLIDFGDRPVGVKCPAAIFAYPLGMRQVAVVHVADRGPDPASGRPVTGFFLLVLDRSAYNRYLGDPFALANRLPPVWDARETLPTESWPAEPLPRRTVDDVRTVLRRVKAGALREDEDPEAEDFQHTVENSESPALLGGAQVLVDGGRLAFERAEPDTALLQGLWTLLPDTTRSHLWPASFAFSNRLNFDVLVVPRYRSDELEGYTREEEAADYPQGRYELNLQVAAESGNQRELDALFSRASFRETWRLAVTLLVVMSVLLLGFRLFDPGPEPSAPRPVDVEKKAALAGGIVAVQDPWSSLGMMQVGNSMWLKKERR